MNRTPEKKIFFLVSSLGAGGAERVFWLLAQYFSNRGYTVSIVMLNGADSCFSTALPGIDFIDLGASRASASILKLFKLIRAKKPYAVFSTVDHLNLTLGLLTWVVKIPYSIARASNNPSLMSKFYNRRERWLNSLTGIVLLRVSHIVCQTCEMKSDMEIAYPLTRGKLCVIANPVYTHKLTLRQNGKQRRRLITIGRLVAEKCVDKLLKILQQLPSDYFLTILGDGPLRNKLITDTEALGLQDKVKFLGVVHDVSTYLADSDLLIMTSATEGFPNVVLEALSAGVPVVCYKVAGIDALVKENYNGYIINQDDEATMIRKIIEACQREWLSDEIKNEIHNKFGLEIIGRQYENLIC